MVSSLHKTILNNLFFHPIFEICFKNPRQMQKTFACLGDLLFFLLQKSCCGWHWYLKINYINSWIDSDKKGFIPNPKWSIFSNNEIQKVAITSNYSRVLLHARKSKPNKHSSKMTGLALLGIVLAKCSWSGKERTNIRWLLETENSCGLPMIMSATQCPLLDGSMPGKGFCSPAELFRHTMPVKGSCSHQVQFH